MILSIMNRTKLKSILGQIRLGQIRLGMISAFFILFSKMGYSQSTSVIVEVISGQDYPAFEFSQGRYDRGEYERLLQNLCDTRMAALGHEGPFVISSNSHSLDRVGQRLIITVRSLYCEGRRRPHPNYAGSVAELYREIMGHSPERRSSPRDLDEFPEGSQLWRRITDPPAPPNGAGSAGAANVEAVTNSVGAMEYALYNPIPNYPQAGGPSGGLEGLVVQEGGNSNSDRQLRRVLQMSIATAENSVRRPTSDLPVNPYKKISVEWLKKSTELAKACAICLDEFYSDEAGNMSPAAGSSSSKDASDKSGGDKNSENNKVIVQLNCDPGLSVGHIFCEVCIQRHFESDHRCPICRRVPKECPKESDVPKVEAINGNLVKPEGDDSAPPPKEKEEKDKGGASGSAF